MNSQPDPDRRQFLALTGLGAAGLAGCTDRQNDAESPMESGEEEDSSPAPTDGARTVAVIVQPNPTALREAQMEVSEALEEGDLEQEEAEQELAEREQELIETAIADASARIDEAGAVHADTVAAEGTLLVEGDANVILDLLEQPSISAVLSQQRFEEAEQRGGEGGADSGTELPDDEELSDDETDPEADEEEDGGDEDDDE